jgi:hypothetical protein
VFIVYIYYIGNLILQNILQLQKKFKSNKIIDISKHANTRDVRYNVHKKKILNKYHNIGFIALHHTIILVSLLQAICGKSVFH